MVEADQDRKSSLRRRPDRRPQGRAEGAEEQHRQDAAKADCSRLTMPARTGAVLTGDIVVVDAPPLPTSKEQCKDGGWRAFATFKNQGDCVSFLATHGRKPPAAPG